MKLGFTRLTDLQIEFLKILLLHILVFTIMKQLTRKKMSFTMIF